MTGVRVVSKKEAMQILGCSKRTLERRMAAGEFATSIVHGPHGPERRIHLPAPADDAPAPGGDAASPASLAAVTPATSPANPAPSLDADTVRAIVLAWVEVQDENRAWARRYDALRAEVESLRRPWWRRGWDRVRRRG